MPVAAARSTGRSARRNLVCCRHWQGTGPGAEAERLCQAPPRPGEHFRQMVDRTGGLSGLTGREHGRGNGLDDGAQLRGIARRAVTRQTQGTFAGAPSAHLPGEPETHARRTGASPPSGRSSATTAVEPGRDEEKVDEKGAGDGRRGPAGEPAEPAGHDDGRNVQQERRLGAENRIAARAKHGGERGHQNANGKTRETGAARHRLQTTPDVGTRNLREGDGPRV